MTGQGVDHYDSLHWLLQKSILEEHPLATQVSPDAAAVVDRAEP